jgi:hypothetical protein
MGTLKSKAARAHRGGKRRATHTAVLREAIDHGSDKLSNRNQFGGMLALGRATEAQSAGLAGEKWHCLGPIPQDGGSPAMELLAPGGHVTWHGARADVPSSVHWRMGGPLASSVLLLEHGGVGVACTFMRFCSCVCRWQDRAGCYTQSRHWQSFLLLSFPPLAAAQVRERLHPGDCGERAGGPARHGHVPPDAHRQAPQGACRARRAGGLGGAWRGGRMAEAAARNPLAWTLPQERNVLIKRTDIIENLGGDSGIQGLRV